MGGVMDHSAWDNDVHDISAQQSRRDNAACVVPHSFSR